MRTKQMLSLFMLVLGVALLVAATTVGAATSATQRTGKAGVTKGGTLRVNEATRRTSTSSIRSSPTAPTTGRCSSRLRCSS